MPARGLVGWLGLVCHGFVVAKKKVVVVVVVDDDDHKEFFINVTLSI